MDYATLNFVLDVFLIFISLSLLIRDYPVRTSVLTLMCILSYILPLSFVEDAVDPQPQQPVVIQPAQDDKTDAPADPAQQAAALAQANPTQTLNNVMSLWSAVLSNLSPMTSGNGEQFDTKKAVEERMGAQSPHLSDKIKSASNASFVAFKDEFLTHRLGRAMKPHDSRLVEQFWFFARCCLLAGAAYFLFSDWKTTMSIITFGVIPIHYYFLLFMFLTQNWEKTRRWWGNIGITLLVLVCVVAALNLVRLILKLRGAKEFHIPDPTSYKARINGTDYEYEVWPDHIKVADIKLDLSLSYLDPETPSILRFTSGAAVQFVPRVHSENDL